MKDAFGNEFKVGDKVVLRGLVTAEQGEHVLVTNLNHGPLESGREYWFHVSHIEVAGGEAEQPPASQPQPEAPAETVPGPPEPVDTQAQGEQTTS
jgi:hypothetical protein